MPEIINILFNLTWDSPSEMEILYGIRDFMRQRPYWALRLERDPAGAPGIPIAARILTQPRPDQKRWPGRSSGPVVSVVDDPAADLRVLVDDAQIGALAAGHLRARGFRDLVFASVHAGAGDAAGKDYYHKRYRGFVAAAAELGSTVTLVSPMAPPASPPARMPAWLRDLPRPSGVFCPSDRAAMLMLDLCRFAGIRVPEQVAVIGADNEVLWCETSVPSLTTVAIPWRQIGHDAARWIDRLLAGGKPPRSGLVLMPVDTVIARHSTDSVALSNTTMVQALTHIRENAFAGLTVKSLSRAIGVPRRQLDRLFRRHLDRTPYAEIRRLQLDKTKELLACTDLSAREICAATGQSVKHFRGNFRNEVGESVDEFRRKQGRAVGRGDAG